LGKKRTASRNRQQSNKTIKPKNLKHNNDETDDNNNIKQKTDTVATIKTNWMITYKVSSQS
jgi:hypothetical protein